MDRHLREIERGLPAVLSLDEALALAHHWDRGGLSYPAVIEQHRVALLCRLRRVFRIIQSRLEAAALRAAAAYAGPLLVHDTRFDIRFLPSALNPCFEVPLGASIRANYLIDMEGPTDVARYARLLGMPPADG